MIVTLFRESEEALKRFLLSHNNRFHFLDISDVKRVSCNVDKIIRLRCEPFMPQGHPRGEILQVRGRLGRLHHREGLRLRHHG